MGTQFGQNCLCLLVGRAKAHIPGVLIMFPCALPWEEEPKDRLLLQNLMAIRITPDSYPNHAPPHSLPPIPHPGCFGGACRGPLESLVEECTCLVCSASNRCCLPTASAQSGPTIQQYNFKAANHLRIIPSNHTPESYPESYPRIIPPIQTSRPDYGKKIHTHMGWNLIWRTLLGEELWRGGSA